MERYLTLYEYTLQDWKGQLTSVIKRTYADRKRIKGAIESSVQLISFNPKTGEGFYAVEPTKAFSNTKADEVTGQPQGDTNLYTVRMLLVDWDKWVPNKDWVNLSVEDYRDVISVVDIKWNCDCMSYHWTGLQYQQSQANAAIYPTNIPDKQWRARHIKDSNNIPGICKHQAAVVAKALRYPQTMLNEIKKMLR